MKCRIGDFFVTPSRHFFHPSNRTERTLALQRQAVDKFFDFSYGMIEKGLLIFR